MTVAPERDNRPILRTRRVVVPEVVADDLVIVGDEAWLPTEMRHCTECPTTFVLTDMRGRPPLCCSPECWKARQRRLSREISRRRRLAA